jgi:hypothetical protein
LYLAVEKAALLDPQKIRNALSSIEIPSGQIPSVGSVKFSSNGQNVNIGLVLTQLFNGTGTGAWKTVYPWDFPKNVNTADHTVLQIMAWVDENGDKTKNILDAHRKGYFKRYRR